MIFEKYEVVAFDFDDTLVATIKNVWNQHKHVALTEFGVTVTDEDMRRVWGRPLDEMVEDLYGHPFAVVEPHLIREKPNYPNEIFPESRDLLRKLRAAHKVIALITSTNTRSLTVDFSHNAIESDTFDHVFTIDDCEYRKPDKRVFDPLLSHGYSPEEVVYIGDAASDFFAARNSGFDFIGIGSGLLSVVDFSQLDGWNASGAHAVASIAELNAQVQ
jgi:HAD superfamily hydrolase (TIGR01509 family)